MDNFYIKTLILKNFQKHSNLTLEFTNNINLIIGESATGKSTILRAISWLFFPNSIKGDVVKKENTKKTSVKAILSNGIIIERIKGTTVNRYILNDKDTFDAVGKGELPEQLQKALRVKNIEIDKEKINLNIAKQIALPFLLDKSGTFRMKLFNKMTGNDILDKMFQDYNKEILQLNRKVKSEDERLIEIDKEIENVSERKKIIQEKYNKFKELYESIKTQLELYNSLKEKFNKLQEIQETLKITKEKLNKISIVSDTTFKNLKETSEKHAMLSHLYDKFTTLKEQKTTITNKLKKIKFIEDDKIFLNLKHLAEKEIKLNQQLKIYKQLKDSIADIKNKLKLKSKELEEGIEKFNKLLKEEGVCPLCKQRIT